MKFATITALVGLASAVEIGTPDDSLVQESANMEQLCENMGEIDDESLVEVDADEEAERKKVSGTSKQHYGRTTKQINAENNHILSTQAKCLNFVRKYRGHPKVCNWCKKAKAPSVIWKWNSQSKTWYRWYDNKWHYWGPSKRGFTAVGWTWYKGFWHHNGYVFRYRGGYWYRFQGNNWVRYGATVPIKPKIPRGKKICRPFYMLKKFGFPSSLSAKRLPRCRVGSGKSSVYYMWKDRKACSFLGGRLVYQKHAVCKTGRPHQWQRVTRCVRGAVLTHKGLNYKTGQRHVVKTTRKTLRYTLKRSQGLCKGSRGTKLGGWRHKNASFCKKQCANNSKCNLMIVGEGSRHMYTGTCEIYHAPAKTTGKGDGNRGWSCYKYSAV
jgi:hypothetical protein